VLLVPLLGGCAPRVAPAQPQPPPLAALPPAPVTPAYPEFVYPAVPETLRSSGAASRFERGWRFLQSNDPGQAHQEFDEALRASPEFVPALTGRGYAALASGRHDRALDAFERALAQSEQYAPALVGQGQTLLAVDREADALEAFAAALAADPSLTQLASRVELLRFRQVQAAIDRARAAAADGRLDEARAQYESALARSPESAFLHRELGQVERRAGRTDAALARFRRVAELDPFDAASLAEIGAILEAQGDHAGALAAYRRAWDIDAAPDLAPRIEALVERTREADLPAEFQAIPATPRITRAQLAALVGVRLEGVLAAAPPRQVVVTDTRGHWAERWMQTVAAAGVMDLFENYTFQPEAAVRRVELAEAVRRLAMLGAPRGAALDPGATPPEIADVSTRHLNYAAVSFAVASGVMPLLEDRQFQVSRVVSGGEAIETLSRLRTRVAGGR
jgi:tetratricopeptide (TPR) repeat protein